MLFVLLFISVEGLFFCTGYLVSFFQKAHSDKTHLNAPTILVLGESTSAESFIDKGYEFSWPHQLKKLLQENGYCFEIVNMSKPGTSSGYLLKDLPTYVQKYKPQISISMMGVNDANNLWLKENIHESFLWNFRTIRFFSILQRILENSYDTVKLQKNAGVSFTVGELLSDFSIGNINSYSEKQIDLNLGRLQTDFERSEYLSEVATKLLPPINSFYSDFSNSIKFFKRSLVYSQNADAFEQLAYLYQYFHKNDDCFDLAKDMVSRKIQLEDPLLTYFSRCAYDSNNKEKWKKIFLNLGPFEITLSEGQIPSSTSEHYKRIAQYLHSYKVQMVVMQYPLRNMALLQQTLKEWDDILFVSNQENFNKELQVHRWSELFVDKFAGDFGHTTTYGHKLIAQNVLKTVLEILKKDTYIRKQALACQYQGRPL